MVMFDFETWLRLRTAEKALYSDIEWSCKDCGAEPGTNIDCSRCTSDTTHKHDLTRQAMPMPTDKEIPKEYSLSVNEYGRGIVVFALSKQQNTIAEVVIQPYRLGSSDYQVKSSSNDEPEHPWGAYLYEKALEWVSAHNGYLMPDNTVSELAGNVWRRYHQTRPDVQSRKVTRAPIMYNALEEEAWDEEQNPYLYHKYQLKKPVHNAAQSSTNLEFRNELTGVSHGQKDGRLVALRNNKVVGFIDWAQTRKDVVHIRMLEVQPNARRQGVGSALMYQLRHEFPDAFIDVGYATDEGAQLLPTLEPQTQVDPRIREELDHAFAKVDAHWSSAALLELAAWFEEHADPRAEVLRQLAQYDFDSSDNWQQVIEAREQLLQKNASQPYQLKKPVHNAAQLDLTQYEREVFDGRPLTKVLEEVESLLKRNPRNSELKRIRDALQREIANESKEPGESDPAWTEFLRENFPQFKNATIAREDPLAALTQIAKDAPTFAAFRQRVQQRHLMDLSSQEFRFGRAFDTWRADSKAPSVEDIKSIPEYLTDIRYSRPQIYATIVNSSPHIRIYRAVPVAHARAGIRVGDYVALDRSYATMHGRGVLTGQQGEKYRVIWADVPKTDVVWGQADWAEWTYAPQVLRQNVDNLEDFYERIHKLTTKQSNAQLKLGARQPWMTALDQSLAKLQPYDAEGEFFSPFKQKILEGNLNAAKLTVEEANSYVLTNRFADQKLRTFVRLAEELIQRIENSDFSVFPEQETDNVSNYEKAVESIGTKKDVSGLASQDIKQVEVNGHTYEIVLYKKKSECTDCNGSGVETVGQECDVCNGTGYVPCNACDGYEDDCNWCGGSGLACDKCDEGYIDESSEECAGCNGKGYNLEEGRISALDSEGNRVVSIEWHTVLTQNHQHLPYIWGGTSGGRATQDARLIVTLGRHIAEAYRKHVYPRLIVVGPFTPAGFAFSRMFADEMLSSPEAIVRHASLQKYTKQGSQNEETQYRLRIPISNVHLLNRWGHPINAKRYEYQVMHGHTSPPIEVQLATQYELTSGDYVHSDDPQNEDDEVIPLSFPYDSTHPLYVLSDGHHRVRGAQARNEQWIDAIVTVPEIPHYLRGEKRLQYARQQKEALQKLENIASTQVRSADIALSHPERYFDMPGFGTSLSQPVMETRDTMEGEDRFPDLDGSEPLGRGSNTVPGLASEELDGTLGTDDGDLENQTGTGFHQHEARQLVSALRTITTTELVDGDRLFGAGEIVDGELVGYHVTDDAERLIAVVRNGEILDKEKAHQELGPGLYISDQPRQWMNRSTNKWNFLSTLTLEQRQDLAQAIRRTRALTDTGYVSERERERAERDLINFVQDGDTYIVYLAGQPYNIPFWQPAFLESVGIEPAAQPQVVEVRARGRFLQVDANLVPGQWRELVDAGYDGCWGANGMATIGQAVIWNPAAITMIRVTARSFGAGAASSERFAATEDPDLSDLLAPAGELQTIGSERGRAKANGIARFVSPYGSYRYVYFVKGVAISALQIVSNEPRRGIVAKVWTRPEYRRRGFALKLMERARTDFDEVVPAKDLSESGAAWQDAWRTRFDEDKGLDIEAEQGASLRMLVNPSVNETPIGTSPADPMDWMGRAADLRTR